MEENRHGASIERGTIQWVGEEGYRVASATRYGIVSTPLRPILAAETYEEGDLVYFFLFPDGDGKILGKIE